MSMTKRMMDDIFKQTIAQLQYQEMIHEFNRHLYNGYIGTDMDTSKE
jgi:hypothetical protein